MEKHAGGAARLEPRRPGRPARPVTKEQLLNVAREAFAELGYAGASMGEIATRAGIRKSSLFHHFATKDELYREALAGIVQEIERHIHDAASAGGSLIDRIDRANLATQVFFGENTVAARMLLREFVDGDSAVSVGAGRALDSLLQLMAESLDTSMNEGALPRQDARQLALSIIGVHFLFFASPHVSSRFIGADVFSPAQIEARARAVCSHVRRLIGAPVGDG